MEKTGTAYFVDDARTWEDLIQPHLLEQEKPYEIVKTVMLGKIDYENFITDMLVSRDYLEDPGELSFRSQIWECFCVRQRGRTDGVLVMPDRDGFIELAAYLPEGSLARVKRAGQ